MPTLKKDLIDPEILTEALSATMAGGLQVLWGTDAVVTNASFTDNKVGSKVKIPYYGSIGEWEEVDDGVAFSPRKIDQTDEEAKVRKIGIEFVITDWARRGSAKGINGKDAYQEAAEQIKEGFVQKMSSMLVEAATQPLPDMTVNVYHPTTLRTIDSDLVIDGRAKWGDEGADRSLLLCHSKVENDIWKIKDTNGRPMVVDATTGWLSRFMGYPVGVSDLLKPADNTNPKKYTSILIAPRALVCWYNGEPLVETDRDISSGADKIVASTFAVVHRYKRLPGKKKPGVVLLVHN